MTLEKGHSQASSPIRPGFQAQEDWCSPQMLRRRLRARWGFKIEFLLVQPDNRIRNFKISLFTSQHPHFHMRRLEFNYHQPAALNAVSYFQYCQPCGCEN